MLWWVSRPDGKTKVIFCDVGQGDGALIVQGSIQVLIDVGPDNGRMEKCLSDHLPFWERQLEAVIISHWDSDHGGGLKSILSKYKVNNLYANHKPNGEFEQKFYTADLRQNDVLRIGEIDFDIRWPEEIRGVDNDDSVVIEMEQTGKRYLFLGDVGREVEQKMVWRRIIETRNLELETRIIKISHHGSSAGTSDEILDYWKPDIAVISVGEKNRFGHPTKEVLEKLEKRGVKIWRIDEEGELGIRN